MGHYIDQAAIMLAPIAGGTAPRAEQSLSGTGTTEATNTTALSTGSFATIKNGPVAVRVAFLSAPGGGSSVSPTEPFVLGAYEAFNWIAEVGTKHVAIEAYDGATAYIASVWTSSGAILLP